MSERNGGPAFPGITKVEEYSGAKERYVEHYVPVGGMSLRDYFAGQFLVSCQIPVPTDAAEVARNCYRMADAMLAERAKAEAR